MSPAKMHDILARLTLCSDDIGNTLAVNSSRDHQVLIRHKNLQSRVGLFQAVSIFQRGVDEEERCLR